MTVDKIAWGDPPPAARGPSASPVWVERLAPFRDRPGEWGRLPGEWPAEAATRINRGLYRGIEAGEFQATARAVPSGKFLIWVRFVGGGDR